MAIQPPEEPPKAHPVQWPFWARSWDVIASVSGLIAGFILIFHPELRDPAAWAFVSGLVGILPVNRVLEKLLR